MLFSLLLALVSDSLAVQVGEVTVVAPPAQRAMAIGLAERAEAVREWPGLGRVAPPPFTLVFARDSAELARLTRGRAPAWGAGVVFPGARTIMLRADLPDLERTLRHEVAHLVLRERVRARVPLWFDEGYAAWASGELERFINLELNLAVAGGRLPSLDRLDAMLRASARSADLAYALAATAVAEVARRPPEGSLERLVAGLGPGESFADALEAATGLTPSRFEEVWHKELRSRYSLATWFLASGIWILMALLVLASVWLRRRRDAPRRAALDVGWPIPDLTADPEGGENSCPAPVDQPPPRH
jgi:hypothetical protein